jgi:hypothetical protein
MSRKPIALCIGCFNYIGELGDQGNPRWAYHHVEKGLCGPIRLVRIEWAEDDLCQ